LAPNYNDYKIWVYIRDNRGIYLPDNTQNGSWYLSVTNTLDGNSENLASVGVTYSDYVSPPPGFTGIPLVHGLWRVDFVNTVSNPGLNQGLLQLKFEGYDHAGNMVRRNLRYYVNDPATEGTGKILNINQDTPPITDRFLVRGNALATVDGIGTYDLKLTSLDDPDDFVYLAQNQPALISESVIGIVDGTVIPTGQYRLYLQVRCSEGCVQAVDERIIEVQNVARLGNLDMSFSDLDVTLGGVPIPLVRTYSSGLTGQVDAELQGGFAGDFSPGWNLNLLQSTVSVSHPRGTTASLDDPFAKDTRVFVSLPSGQVHRFTFAPVPFGGTFIPRLSPDPEFRSELTLENVDPQLRLIPNQSRNDGTYLSANGDKESIPSNFGTAWILRTEEGIEYYFDIHSGRLTSIRALSGARIDLEESTNGTTNTITIATRNTGFDNSEGQTNTPKVIIERELHPDSTSDSPRYRVVKIRDAVVEPTPDREVQYRYGAFDSNTGAVDASPLGNLAQVESLDGTVSSYAYLDTFLPRHLTTIYDNTHQSVFTASYFADVNSDTEITSADIEDERFGRLKETANSNGQPTTFSYDFVLSNGLKVRSTNIAGNTVEQVLNGRGDTVRTLTLVGDSLNAQEKRYIATVTRYNLRGLPTARSKPFYIVGSDNRFTDEPPNPAENPLAWSELRQYDANGRPKTVTDAYGGVTTYTYDDVNGVHTVTDPSGITSLRKFDPQTGNLLATYSYNQQSGPGTKLNHITYDYDQWGNQTHQWLNPSDGPEILQTQSHYGETGFLQWTQQLGQPRQYYAYDGNGQRILTWYSIPDTNQAGHSITRVTYQFNDFAGPSNPFPTTGFDNHALDSAQFEVRGSVVFNESNTQQLLDLLITTFDQPGSTVRKTSESGSIKDSQDRVIESRTMSLDSLGNQTWFVSRTMYDVEGRVQYQTDSLPSGTQPSKVTGTWHEYDPDNGRVLATVRRLGQDITVTTTSIGRGSAQLSTTAFIEMSRTVTDYDDLGRVETSTEFSNGGSLQSSTTYNLKGQVTQTLREEYGSNHVTKVTFITRTVYDVHDRVILQTDPYINGEVVFGTETLYDGLTDRVIGSVRRENVSVNIDSTGHTTVNEQPGLNVELYRSLSFFDGQRLVKSVDPSGGETDYEVDAFGRTIATIAPAVEVAGFDVPQRLRTETEYDSRGRTAAQHSGIVHDLTGQGQHDRREQITTRYVYDDANRVVRTVYSDNSYSQVHYDALGQKVAESKQVAEQVNLVWSDAERSFIESVTNNVVPTRLMEYDNSGRLSAVELPAVADPLAPNSPLVHPRYEYGYNAAGQQNLIRDPYQRETRIVFDELGRQIERTLPLGYGADGKPGTGDDATAEGFTEHFEYNTFGQLILHTSFEGAEKQYVYAPLSRRLTTEYFSLVPGALGTNPGPEHIVRFYQVYDNHGRPLNVFVPGDGRSESSTFDSQGRLLTTSSPEGNIRYGYDVLGRMILKQWSGSGYVVQPGAEYENEAEYRYDSLGRLASVKQVRRSGMLLQSPEETKYRYGASGNLRQTEYQNGVFHDFVYDSLGRLDLLEHWHDANDNGRRDSGELRAQFDYTVRSDGKRTGSTEKIWSESGSLVSDQTFSWDYDSVDRLIKEEATGIAGGDYELDWVYDLVGNRLSQSKALKDASGAVVATESTTYTYDANDRLQAETFARTGTTPSSSNTVYTYNKTQQTSKATTAGSVTTTQTFSYNRQGLMASVIIETSIEATLKRVDYSYDTGGHRVGTKEYEASSSSPQAWTLLAATRYLTDEQNPTGYSQVLQETKFGSGSTPSKKIIYTIGHDQISQTVYENWNPANSNFELQTSHFFGSDGHGSVRVLYDAAAAIARDAQLLAQYYSYDAYGNLLSIGGLPLTPQTSPLTTYLYSGESFDFRISQQYLRARWYDPSNGRFNQLDPFAGKSADPQSFHKYAYVHGDPVNGVDPTGMFLESLWARVKSDAANLSAYMSLQAQILYMSTMARISTAIALMAAAQNRYSEFARVVFQRGVQVPSYVWNRAVEVLTRLAPRMQQVPGGGIRAHEGGPFKAHTLQKHVGKSFDWLVGRVVGQGIHRASSFPSLEVADDVIATAVSQNQAAITRFAQVAPNGMRMKEIVVQFNHSIGLTVSYERGQMVAQNATYLILRIVKDNTMAQGWRVLTAFPSPIPKA